MGKRYKNGFGVLEVLLAGIVIIIVLGALVFLARNTLNNSTYLGQKTQATFLAQEGIEIVRNIRDTNYIDKSNETKWNNITINNKGQYTSYSENFDYQIISDNRSDPSKSEAKRLTAGRERISLDNIEYTRYIQITKKLDNLLSGDSDMQKNAFIATVFVKWESSYKRGEVVIKELITNSRQGF